MSPTTHSERSHARRLVKPDLRLTVECTDKPDGLGPGRPILEFMGRVMTYVPGEGLASPLWAGGFSAAEKYSGLAIRAQAHAAEFYGWSPEYWNILSVGERQAREMTRVLHGARLKMESIDAQLGATADLGGYCARFMRALGASVTHPFGRFDASVAGRYVWMSPDTLRYWLDEQMGAWQERQGLR